MNTIWRRVIFIFSFLCAANAVASESFEDEGLHLDPEFILVNHEWFVAPDFEGYTRFGWIAPIYYRLQTSDDVSVDIGGIFIHQYGQPDELQQVDPMLRLRFRPDEKQQWLFGTIEQHHQIHPALTDQSRRIDDGSQQGLQRIYQYGNWYSDFWIDWHTIETATDAEQFETGFVIRASNDGGALSLELLSNHAGGQLTSSPDGWNNIGGRLGFERIFGSSSPDKELRLTLSTLFSSWNSDVKGDSSQMGFELGVDHSRVFSDRWSRDIELSYYTGDELDMLRGFQLYQNSSLGKMGISADYHPDNSLIIEMALDLWWFEDVLSNSQSVSLRWQY